MTLSELTGQRITEESVREALAQFDGFPVITPGGRFTGEIRNESDCKAGEFRADWDDSYAGTSLGGDFDGYFEESEDGPYICTGYPGSVWDEYVQMDIDNGDLGWPVVSNRWVHKLGRCELVFLGFRGDGTEDGTHFVTLNLEARDYDDFDSEDEEGNDTDVSKAHAILV